MDVSRYRYPFVILIPLYFVAFSFFLWLQTGFEAKAAFVSSRLLHLPVDIQFYYDFKKIYTDIPLELPKDDQVLFLQGFNDVL